jgi:hypothetical protein
MGEIKAPTPAWTRDCRRIRRDAAAAGNLMSNAKVVLIIFRQYVFNNDPDVPENRWVFHAKI